MAPTRIAALASRALARAWARGLLPPVELDADALEKAALRGASREALGPDTGWREAFERLIRSLRGEAQLNPLGLSMAQGQIVMLLRSRMRAVKLWADYPEMLDRAITPPIVVLGQMRSGTTRMQRLLACDPRFAWTRAYETLTPVPMRGRKLRARIVLAILRRLNPETLRIHPASAGAAEEEFGWLSFGFGPAQFEAQWRVPAFTRWWEEAGKAALYREFRALLLTNAWARGEDPAKPWILKMPQYVEDLPALLDAFPGARLIRLDRDPAEIVASSASLVWNQMRVQSDHADRQWIGREWLRKTLLRQEIAATTRHARPEVPQIDIGFEDMNRDWRGEIGRIYDFLGLELSPGLLERMAAYLKGARAHEGHRYHLSDFGLAAENLSRRTPRCYYS